jgi:hypothetical protein
MTVYANADKARRVHTPTPQPMARLPLHAELYLLAHNDDTGELHINEQSLTIGLAGAILLDLWLAGHIEIGWTFNEWTQQWKPEPGRLTRIKTEPVGDPLTDAALAAVEQTGRMGLRGDQTRAWLRGFAASGLYERVRANLITVGLLQRTRRHRFAGLVKTETYLAVHDAFAVRARARVRNAVTFHERQSAYQHEAPDDQCVALCGLVAVLELAEYLYVSGLSIGRLAEWLRYAVEQHKKPTISTVITAVDAGRGDLAVAAMR